MSKWCLILCLTLIGRPSTAAPRDSIPKPVGYVNDFEGLLTIDQKAALELLLRDFEKNTTIEMALVTIDTTMTTSADFESYILEMFNAWGVGKKDKNNGILVGISRSYRRMRVQNGDGIAEVLSDQETKRIIDEVFIPSFKKGDYYRGIRDGLQALMDKLH